MLWIRLKQIMMPVLVAYTFIWVLRKARFMALAVLSLPVVLCFVLLRFPAGLLCRGQEELMWLLAVGLLAARKRMPCACTISSKSLIRCHHLMQAGKQLMIEILLWWLPEIMVVRWQHVFQQLHLLHRQRRVRLPKHGGCR